MSRYYNTENAYVPIGPRQSVPPYGVTRDFTDEEVAASVDLRWAINDRKWLVPWDGKSPLPKQARLEQAPKKANYTVAPDSVGGQRVQIKSKDGAKAVEYIVADSEGSDSVGNASADPSVLAALPEQGRSTEYIEEGTSARDATGAMKTAWVNASDAMEAALNKETTGADLEYDDENDLTEGDDKTRTDPLDADHEIAGDYGQVLRDQGRMGAELVSTQQVMTETVSKAAAELASAVAPNVDDGEVAAGATDEVASFLKQSFSAKKWVIAKTSDAAFLENIKAVTQSENLKSIVSQRLSELEVKP